MRAARMQIAAVVGGGEVEEACRAVVEDVKVDRGAVTRHQAGHRHKLEKVFKKK